MLGTEPFEGRAVRLAPMGGEDAATVAPWYADGEWLRLYDGALAIPKTTAQVAEMIDAANKSSTEVLFGLRRRQDDTLVGMAGHETGRVQEPDPPALSHSCTPGHLATPTTEETST